MGGEIECKAYAPELGQLLASYTADALDASDPAFFVDDAQALAVGRDHGRAQILMQISQDPGRVEPRGRGLQPRSSLERTPRMRGATGTLLQLGSGS